MTPVLQDDDRPSASASRLPIAVLVFVAAAVVAVVQLRLSRGGIEAYGFAGAEYIEHVTRLKVLLALRGAGDTGWLQALRDMDGSYPPLMHLLTMP
jgi:hypothetical protein